MTGETPEVRSEKRKPTKERKGREEREYEEKREDEEEDVPKMSLKES